MKKSQQGFTLIEVIVVFTLLAMIMAMIFSGIDSGRRTVEKGEKRITAINEVRVVQTLVRHQLSRAMALGFSENDEGEIIKFIGDEDSITFVSHMPGYLGSGGPHIQKIEIASDKDGKFLQYRHGLFSNYDDEDEVSLFGEAEPIVLLENVKDGFFSFVELDEEGEVTEWSGDLEDQSSLPLMIQLDMQMNEQAREQWPLLQVAIQIDGSNHARRRAGLHQLIQDSANELQ